ncbi:MAG: hypothetical protein JXR37_25365 [Kiritimatiellae bacterium]|nr:hypothetical protein [Kiritimatiellia bacterium]
MSDRQDNVTRSGFRVLPVCALALLLASCGGRKQAASETPAAGGVEKVTELGPATARLSIDRTEITIADRVNLVLEVTVEEAYEAQLPAFGEKLEQFGIVDYETAQPKLLEGNKLLHRRAYVLEPFLSGDYLIPPMKVVFWKKGEEGAKKHELETEELTVRVKSLLPEKVAELTINDIAPPVELPARKRAWWIGVAAAGGLALAVGLVVALARRKRGAAQAAAAERIPAHDQAFAELENLLARDLINQGQIKAFYQGVSDILRRYIERRFGLRAPERTTEEFLAELGNTNVLAPAHKDLLKVFLGHCDLVKFAEHQPEKADIQKTFDSCKTFILETKPANGEAPRPMLPNNQ